MSVVNKRLIRLTILVACLISILFSAHTIFSTLFKDESIINKEVRSAFNATCKVRAHGSIGTGTLLDTGYILTAKHVIDANNNGDIELRERAVKVQFFGDKPIIVEATVVAAGKYLDFAILEPHCPMKSDIQFSKSTPLIGDKIFTIGMTRGDNPHITSGFISAPSMNDGNPRASCFISFGNSGGGIFDSSKRLVGVINAIFMNDVRGWAYNQNGMRIAMTRHLDQLNQVALYVPIDLIRNELVFKNVSILIDSPPTDYLPGPLVSSIITTSLQILFVLIGVWYARRYIFC